MSTMKVPSSMLLRALRQSSSSCNTCQVRMASNYMPRSRYHKPNGLDKFHRKQKKAFRDEKQATHDRAAAMTITPPSAAPQSSDPSVQGTSSSTVTTIPFTTSISTPHLSFTIARTSTQNIPVYETSKAGGNKHITQIRRLSGDLESMATQLRHVLSLPQTYTDVRGRKKESITINRLTKQLIVRGWRGAEVKKWAEGLGF